MSFRDLFAAVAREPRREYVIAVIVALAFALDLLFPVTWPVLLVAALIGSIPTAWSALRSVIALKINIDTFNVVALIISFVVGEFHSAAFIVLMLDFAALLDWQTESRSRNAVEELLRLKPEKALRVKGNGTEEIPVDAIRKGDVLLIENGFRIPADGMIVFGNAAVNEAPVTGESVPVEKVPGDRLLAGTLNESGTVKMRVTGAGKESTLERMATLIDEARKNKSRSERLADRFATIFLPIVLAGGVLVYVFTKSPTMTAAFFLVACADDMAVAIPLAIKASLGKAAERGVIVKGGEWMDVLGSIDALVLDKTGTLTYGTFAFRDEYIASGVKETDFWNAVGIAEKFSEHPVGRAIFKEAAIHVKEISDPDDTKTFKGSGIVARSGKTEVAVGDESLMSELKIKIPPLAGKKLDEQRKTYGGTTAIVVINKKFAGLVTVADIQRTEAGESLRTMRELGVTNILMFTGDNEEAAKKIAKGVGVDRVRASMLPEDKLKEIEKMAAAGTVAMVGDGINDAPALARADVGIAMGSGGSAVAVESADVVILTDNLARLPEMVALGRRTTSVIRWDMVIWIISNAVGFALVLTGVAGPALAAFYNFATDFLPLMNSVRLFRTVRV